LITGLKFESYPSNKNFLSLKEADSFKTFVSLSVTNERFIIKNGTSAIEAQNKNFTLKILLTVYFIKKHYRANNQKSSKFHF